MQKVFNSACDMSTSDVVTQLFQLGGDPLWVDEQGVKSIEESALSNVEPRRKIQVLQSSFVAPKMSNCTPVCSFKNSICPIKLFGNF